MSTVHRGWDVLLQRAVAIKLYLPNQDEASRRRFEEEARMLSALSHPGLVTVYDSGTDDGQPYLVLQLVDGQNLRDRMADGPLPPHEVRTLGARLAEILAYVHSQGVIHRDVKPSNVLLDRDGSVYLADFGISRMVDAPRLTATGQFVGTAGYLAPEQVLGGAVGPAVDVYALGLVLLECLTGQAEYTGSDVEMAVARLNRPPRIPGDIPLDLASAIGAMTAREPHKRPTATESAAYLYNALAAPRADRTQTAAMSRWLGRRLPGRRLRLAAAGAPLDGLLARRRLTVASAAAITLIAGSVGWTVLTNGTNPAYPASVDSAPPASMIVPVRQTPVPASPAPATPADTGPAAVAPDANEPAAPRAKDRKDGDRGGKSGNSGKGDSGGNGSGSGSSGRG